MSQHTYGAAPSDEMAGMNQDMNEEMIQDDTHATRHVLVARRHIAADML